MGVERVNAMTDSCFLPERYSEIEVLSRGTHTSLVRALDSHTNIHLALKLVHAPSWMTPAEADAYLSRASESQSPLVGLSTSGLAEVFEVERTDDSLILVREFVEGRPLSRLFESNWLLGTFEARRIAAEVGSALDAVAETGLSHHALTPDNIIVRETGQMVVTDAGVSFAARQFMVAGQSCVVRQRHETGGDLHALASLVFRAVTGMEPDDVGRLAGADLPRGMREPIRRALARDRAAFRSASEFASALDPIPTAAIFRHVWRPAAAAGLLASLATVGGNAVSEARRSASHHPHHATPISAAIPVSVLLPNVLDTLSTDDRAALRTAVRREGPALLARSEVAQLLDINEAQRLQIMGCLAVHRNRVGQIVETAAGGAQIDSATAMTELKQETGARILNALNATQRTRWGQLESASSAGDRQQ